MNCPQCQHVLRGDARFCDGCGLSVISLNTPTEPLDAAALADILTRPDPLLGQVLDSKYELVARPPRPHRTRFPVARTRKSRH